MIAVDVRVLAATNRNLDTAVTEGHFRQDLFYRLNVFPIQIPPLRDRADDISLLVDYLIDRFGTKAGKRFRSINKKTLELFEAYDWPGNIRELQNVIERAVILCEGDTFSVDEAWLTRVTPKPAKTSVPLVASLVEEILGMNCDRISLPSNLSPLGQLRHGAWAFGIASSDSGVRPSRRAP